MNFDSNSIEYEITWAKIEADKAKNIFEHMKWSLALITSIDQTSLDKSQSHNEETDWQASKENDLQDRWHDVSEF